MICTAKVENGIIRLPPGLNLPDGAEVQLTLPDSPDDPAAILQARFPNSFGGLSPQDADQMMNAIREECEGIDPDGWR